MGKKITKDMTFMKVLEKYPKTFEVFQKHGLHCVGCAIAHFENIEQGATVHGIDVNKLMEDLNKKIEKRK